jgi:D-cysteine desulfhydrase
VRRCERFDVPWLPLADRPSPLRPVPALDAAAFSPSAFVKEEASLSTVVGGTKVRGLEFLLGNAVSLRADTIVTSAIAGSNYLAALAYHSRRVGLKCVAAVRPAAATFWSRRNALIAYEQGCSFVPAAQAVSLRSDGRFLTQLAESLDDKGSRTVRLPFGGGNALAALGNVVAAREAAAQLADEVLPDALDVVVAVGTGWTAAGLLVGFAGLPFPVRVVAVPAAYERRLPRNVVVKHVEALRGLLRNLGQPCPDQANVSLCWAPPASPGAVPLKAASRWATVDTDPLYTEGAFLTFADLVRLAPSGRAVIFWNTADLRSRAALDDQVRAGELPAGVAKVLLG